MQIHEKANTGAACEETKDLANSYFNLWLYIQPEDEKPRVCKRPKTQDQGAL